MKDLLHRLLRGSSRCRNNSDRNCILQEIDGPFSIGFWYETRYEILLQAKLGNSIFHSHVRFYFSVKVKDIDWKINNLFETNTRNLRMV